MLFVLEVFKEHVLVRSSAANNLGLVTTPSFRYVSRLLASSTLK